MFRHRPTLKQQNKPFKGGKHASNRSIARKTKGKVEQEVVSGPKTGGNAANTKAERRTRNVLEKKKQKDTARDERRFGTGGIDGPAKVIAAISLGSCVDMDSVLKMLAEHDGETVESGFDTPVSRRLAFGRVKQKMTFLRPKRDLISVLDAAKVADVVLCFIPATYGVDAVGESFVNALRLQGVPSIMGLVQGMDKVEQKHQQEAKKIHAQYVSRELQDEAKCLPCDSKQDVEQVLRHLMTYRVRTSTWRDARPTVLAESLSFVPVDTTEGGEQQGEMLLTGYIRGRNLAANHLVHVPGCGDYQLSKITTAVEPMREVRTANGMEEDVSVAVLEEADDQQETLSVGFAATDMENEQTWPTEEEMAEAEASHKEETNIVRRPKGMSEYQQSWITDGDQEDVDDEDIEDNTMLEPDEPSVHGDDASMGGDEDMDMEDEDLTPEERERAIAEHKAMAAEEDRQFPDEVDTPLDRTCSERFARFRGLKSFRTSSWDVKENLPAQWARLYQFDAPAQARKRALADDDGVRVGTYVTLHLKNVPLSVYEKCRTNHPLTTFGLLKYEQKYSMLNFAVQTTSSCTEPLRSKDTLICQIGSRRFKMNPVFSQNNMNCNKNKYEQFLQLGRFGVASMIGPIQHTSVPILMFKSGPNGEVGDLVASGTFMNVNPDRLVIKRVVLTGYPFKIHKKKATIRFMFFNPADIRYFKPVELHSKFGKRGVIIEPLGTHGYMKCSFDSTVMHHDTICMYLYKRMFPKWTTEVSRF